MPTSKGARRYTALLPPGDPYTQRYREAGSIARAVWMMQVRRALGDPISTRASRAEQAAASPGQALGRYNSGPTERGGAVPTKARSSYDQVLLRPPWAGLPEQAIAQNRTQA